MAVWIVRAGVDGGQEEAALQQGLAVIGWNEVGDVSHVQDEAALDEMLTKAFPEALVPRIRNWRSQLWAFSKRIAKGDIIVLPLKTTKEIAIGKVTGDYFFVENAPDGLHHQRAVEWLVTDLPRSTFMQDLLYTFGAFMTVCRVQRNNAEERIAVVLKGKPDPGPEPGPVPGGDVDELPDVDPAQAAYDRIVKYIHKEFPAAELEKLVEGLLRAMGYHTTRKESGVQDKGVDVLAARGELGFGAPRICVQVKHTQDSIDRPAVQQLIGVMDDFGAEQGLFVSWGGFKKTVIEMERDKFFQIRLWTQAKLVDKVLEHYDGLPDKIRERLPLRSFPALESKAEAELSSDVG